MAHMLVGFTFGSLTVLERDFTVDVTKGRHWICKCICNKTISVSSYSLNSGNYKSCGCLKKKRLADFVRTHGQSSTRLYKIWVGMKKRCYKKNCKEYIKYGAKGIKICEAWLNSYETFATWSHKNNYADNLSIDRYPDKNGNYEPGNCRWATSFQQSNNRNNNVIKSPNLKLANGELAEKFAASNGIPYNLFIIRIEEFDWSVEDAATTPPKKYRDL